MDSAYYSLPTSFALHENVLLPCVRELAHGSAWSQTYNCNSLLLQSKPIFSGKSLAAYLFLVNTA